MYIGCFELLYEGLGARGDLTLCRVTPLWLQALHIIIASVDTICRDGVDVHTHSIHFQHLHPFFPKEGRNKGDSINMMYCT